MRLVVTGCRPVLREACPRPPPFAIDKRLTSEPCDLSEADPYCLFERSPAESYVPYFRSEVSPPDLIELRTYELLFLFASASMMSSGISAMGCDARFFIPGPCKPGPYWSLVSRRRMFDMSMLTFRGPYACASSVMVALRIAGVLSVGYLASASKPSGSSIYSLFVFAT